MKHWILSICLLIVVIATQVLAGTNGSLSGTVKDKNGKGVQSVVVKIIGTTRGAYSKPNGSFNITNIPAGTWSVEFRALSYKIRRVSANIRADETTNLGT